MNWIEKHRPQTFTDLVGINEICQTLEGFILSGDIPHLLFHSEQPGTGKTTVAQIVGRMLLGEWYDNNFIEINASDTRDEADIRKRVVRAIRHKPIGSSLRVIFLDEADGLKPTAQDILKRPIEKTTNTEFIFACNDVSAIIKAIRSRCAVFEFKRIGEADIVEGLKRIADKEELTFGDEVLRNIARKVEGDMRSAVNELQKVSALNNRNSEIERIVQQYMKKEVIA